MNLALIIGVWKRHDLEKIVIDRFKAQAEKYGFHIIIAGSEGESSAKLAEGCIYIETPNEPLSNKYQVAVEKAKELDVDGVIVMGSDNMVNDEYFDFIYSLSPKEETAIGLLDIYFFDTLNEEYAWWKGYKNATRTAGAGRFFSHKILNDLNWRIWDDGINKGMDSNSNKRLRAIGIEDGIYSSKHTGAVLVDVKHTVSITNRALIRNCETKDKALMIDHFGKDTVDLIYNLQKPLERKHMFSASTKKVRFKVTENYNNLIKDQIYTVSRNVGEILKDKGIGIIVQ